MIIWLIAAIIGFGGMITCIVLIKKNSKTIVKPVIVTAENLKEQCQEVAEVYEIPIMEINKTINPVSMKKLKRFANLVYKCNQIIKERGLN